VAGADDAAHVPEQTAHLAQQALAFDRVRLDQVELFVGQLPRLVDDLRRDLDLSDVVEECGELGIAPLRAVDVEAIADVEHE
jgi:hypothetical protein